MQHEGLQFLRSLDTAVPKGLQIDITMNTTLILLLVMCQDLMYCIIWHVDCTSFVKCYWCSSVHCVFCFLPSCASFIFLLLTTAVSAVSAALLQFCYFANELSDHVDINCYILKRIN